MTSTWLSTDEVLEDLALNTGSKFGTLEGHYVFGDAPPPTLYEDEDMLHSMNGSFYKSTINNEFGAPDLHGITRMLRMVQDNSSETLEDTALDTGAIVITKPSSLNPNVKEFVPRGITNISKSNAAVKTELASNVNFNTKNDISNQLGNDNVDNTLDQSVKKPNKSKDIEGSSSNISTCESEIINLKSKISNGAKSDCFEVKKQKNVAIATLLRLYASKNNNEVKTPPAPVKLITPDYFEQLEPRTTESSGENDVSVAINEILCSPTPKATSPAFTGKTYTISSCSSLQSSPSCKPPLRLDAEVKQSIDKVNKWFEPEKRKSPGVFLGPISFKKKESVKSPLATSSTVDSEDNSTVDPQEYRPSNYAADLAKKYIERNKKLEKPRDTWKDLDVILKEKDVELNKQKLQVSQINNAHADLR